MMNYGLGQPVPDPWTQRKMAEFRQAMARAGAPGLSQDTPFGPSPAGSTNWAMIVGWGSVVAVAAGIFYFTTKGGTAPVRANRRRRSSKRRRVSRNSGSRRDNAPEARLAHKEARDDLAHLRRTIGAAGLLPEWNRLQDEAVKLVGERMRLLRAGKSDAAVQRKREKLKARIVEIEQGTGYYDWNEANRRTAVAKAKRSPEQRASEREQSDRYIEAMRRTTRNPKLPDWMNKAIYWGRYGNGYYVESPNRNVRLYRGDGAKVHAESVAASLAARYGLPKRKSDKRH